MRKMYFTKNLNKTYNFLLPLSYKISYSGICFSSSAVLLLLLSIYIVTIWKYVGILLLSSENLVSFSNHSLVNRLSKICIYWYYIRNIRKGCNFWLVRDRTDRKFDTINFLVMSSIVVYFSPNRLIINLSSGFRRMDLQHRDETAISTRLYAFGEKVFLANKMTPKLKFYDQSIINFLLKKLFTSKHYRHIVFWIFNATS